MSDSGSGLSVLPMSKSDLQSLPEQMREMFLGCVGLLNEAISALLQSRDEEDFERRFQDVKREYTRYYTVIVADIQQNELEILLQKSFSSLSVSAPEPTPVCFTDTQAQVHPIEAEPLTPIEQTLNDAVEIPARVVRLMLEPVCQDHILSHPEAWESYKTLGVYTTILNFILQQKQQAGTTSNIEQFMIKIIRKCQETVLTVENLIDKLNIGLDSELSAALEDFARANRHS